MNTSISGRWQRWIKGRASLLMQFAHQHIELVLVIPGLLGLCALAWWVTWQRGLPLLELGPLLLDYAVGLIAVSILGYVAWRFKAEYWWDIPKADEIDLHESAAKGNPHAKWVIVKDRIEFIVLFFMLLFAFSKFSGAAELDPAAQLITKWEVSGPAGYQRCCVHPIVPVGDQDLTWGIGYNGSAQSADVIRREWVAHPAMHRLAQASGVHGDAARDMARGMHDITIHWREALAVLNDHSLPRYRAMARRAYGRAFDRAPESVRYALTDEVYNRGLSMAGSRRSHRRRIRDECLPAGDIECTAQALEESCEVWDGQPIGVGMCNRRRDEARVARGDRQ